MDTGSLKLDRNVLPCLGVSVPGSCRPLTSQPDVTLWITAGSLTVSECTRTSQCTVKSWLLNWSGSRAAFCVADLSLSMAGHRAVTSLQLWAACSVSHPPFCEGVCFCLPRLTALIFLPASLSTVGSHYRQALSWPEPFTPFELRGSGKREDVTKAWGSSSQVYPPKFSETLNSHRLPSVDLNLV